MGVTTRGAEVRVMASNYLVSGWAPQTMAPRWLPSVLRRLDTVPCRARYQAAGSLEIGSDSWLHGAVAGSPLDCMRGEVRSSSDATNSCLLPGSKRKIKKEAYCLPGFKISADFRRNFGEYFVFGGNRKMVYRCFPVFSISNFKISKKIISNRPKNQKKLW